MTGGERIPRTGLVIVGSLNADLVVRTERFPGPGETVRGSALATLAGGKGANQAVAAARLGGAVTMVGAVGDDPHGDLLRRSLDSAGVDTSRVRVVPEVATGTAMITVNADGENTIVVSPGANGRLAATDVEQGDAFDGRAVLGLCLEVDAAVVTAAASRARDEGITVLLNLSPYADVPHELLAATDVLLVNEHEAAQLFGVPADGDQSAAVARGLGELGIPRAVVTRGADGATVFDHGEVSHIAAVRVDPVDTTGCGDAFMGALALRLSQGDDLARAARFASLVGAFAATRDGAQSSYPTADELEKFSARR
ncbi:ribokinase [Leifsonia sp. NPDC058292]|uniref:ribokinase n=1 Tax=Leifsonia sp. NPDC058292 TaxID=3346428 RepID=UPI0036DF43A2